MGGVGDGLVELGGRHERLRGLGVLHPVELLDRLFDALQIGIRAPFRGQSGDLDLDHQTGLDEVMGDPFHQRLVELGGLDLLLRLALGDEHPLAVSDLDKPEQGEAVEGLAHGRSADPEAFHQLTL